jgi:hypothetical protein
LGETARALIGESLAEIAEIPGMTRSPDAQLRALCCFTGPEPYFSVAMVTENSIDGLERPVWVRQENKRRKGREGRKPRILRKQDPFRGPREAAQTRRKLAETACSSSTREIPRKHPAVTGVSLPALIGESLAETADYIDHRKGDKSAFIWVARLVPLALPLTARSVRPDRHVVVHQYFGGNCQC